MAEILNTGTGATDVTPAPQGHDEAMLAKVDQKEAELAQIGQDSPKQQDGELLLGKFKSVEELTKAYQELERKLSQAGQQKAQQKFSGDMTEDKASELIDKAGLDVEAMSEYFYENGSLAEEHYEALEKAGIPRAFVDQYIAGVEAQAQAYRDQLMEEIGGEEAFAAMAAWAVANLSEQELEEYNAAVDSGDLSMVRSAVMSLAFRYQQAAGRDPKLIGGQVGGPAGFESIAQLTAAMKDPRYETDPAYRREVEQRLARSNIF